jgi:hypothetical protein
MPRTITFRWIVVAALAMVATLPGCADQRALAVSDNSRRLTAASVAEIATTVAQRGGLRLSEYEPPRIEFEGGAWTALFQRKATSEHGAYFYVIVIDADGSATLRRGVW